MNTYFADAFYFVASANRRDQHYQRVQKLTRGLGQCRMVTTAWVMTEVAAALSSSSVLRSKFIDLIQLLNDNPQTIRIPPNEALFNQGIEMFSKRPDKMWSLTDCISFVVMNQMGLTEALTGDHHFEQAGFRVLLI